MTPEPCAFSEAQQSVLLLLLLILHVNYKKH
jgi:hypothetical protein